MADTTARLDHIQARADAAMHGPWDVRGTNDDLVIDAEGRRIATTLRTVNAEFIAAARQDVPNLVAALRAVLDEHPQVPSADYPWCSADGNAWPCPTVRAIEAELGGAR